MIKEVSGTELEALIEEGKTIVCDFWASWCGPCRMLAPVMESLSGELGDRAEFVKTDIDENPEIAIKYGVMSIPTIIVFEKGGVKAQTVGYMPEAPMRDWLKENLPAE